MVHVLIYGKECPKTLKVFFVGIEPEERQVSLMQFLKAREMILFSEQPDTRELFVQQMLFKTLVQYHWDKLHTLHLVKGIFQEGFLQKLLQKMPVLKNLGLHSDHPIPFERCVSSSLENL